MEDYRDEVRQHLINVRKMILDSKYYDSSGQGERARELLYFAELNLEAAEVALGHLLWEKDNENQ